MQGTIAEESSYGDWSVSIGVELRIAKTSNGLVTVGIGCLSANDCFAYIASKASPCNERETTALLLSSPAGSASTKVMCRRINNELVGIFENREALNLVAFNEIGFKVVVPLRDGSFQISSFSSRGATAALKMISASPQS